MKLRTLSLAAAATLGLASTGAQAQNAYVVGVTAAMTGPAAGTYAPVMDALKAYIDHVNAKGGVNGRTIQLIVADDQDRKSTRLNSSHVSESRMPSSA